LRGECYEDSTINEYCYGPPVQKATQSPTGPPLNLCPKEFVGWHSSSDCKEYYTCDEGSAGAIRVCDEGLKFDKVRNECISEDSVNEFCYGTPLNNESQQLNQASKPEQDPLLDSENTPTEVNACLFGFTGWEGQFFVCFLVIDALRKIHVFLLQLTFCATIPPKSPASFDCTQYYLCYDGVLATSYACGDGLLFDIESGICSFADEVDCVNENSIIKKPSSSPSHGPMTTRFPTLAKKEVSIRPAMGVIDTSFPTLGRDKLWTGTPTISKSVSADPPWLSFARKDSNSANFVSILSWVRLLLLMLM
jgi:hypothetical protein